ncbi:hypothetical protein [Desulfonauticus submarinus]
MRRTLNFIFTLILVLSWINNLWAAKSSVFTQADRERLIRLEAILQTFIHQVDKRFLELREDMNKRFEQIDKRFEQIDKRFEQVDKRFEQVDKRFEEVDKRFEQVDKRFEEVNQRFNEMFSFMWILASIFTTLTASTIGFAFWDRKTMIKKAREETIKVIEKEGKLVHLIQALKQLSKKDPELAKVLRSFGLL